MSTRWVWNDLFRIAFLVIMLVAVIALKDGCSQGVAQFVGGFGVAPELDIPDVSAADPRDPPDPADWKLIPADQVDVEAMFPVRVHDASVAPAPASR